MPVSRTLARFLVVLSASLVAACGASTSLTRSGSPGPTGSPAPAGSEAPSGSPLPSSSTGALILRVTTEGGFIGPAARPIPSARRRPSGGSCCRRLKDGSFVAFDAICTHAGCTVEWDAAAAILLCPCHSAAFDPAHDGAVIEGPAQTPLSKLPIRVDTASGSIFLAW